jgi:thiol-disulfide isomerase/thioredoxin
MASSCAGQGGRGPQGPPLVAATAADLLTLAQEPGASATLVNVWATWCLPCRKEFPDLLRLERRYRTQGLRVALVSADFDSTEARSFLADQGVDFTTYFKIGDDMEFINTLSPDWSGALPATFVYDSAGALVSFWEGKADSARFERAVQEAMGRTTDPNLKEMNP